MTAGSWVTLLAYLVGACVYYAAARRRRVATDGMGLVALAGLGAGVLGARVTEFLVGHGSWAFLSPSLGGRSLVGGVLCGWLGVEAAKRHLGIRRSSGDFFALALAAGEAVGRIGCFLNGCCYGVASGVPWAVYQHDAWRHPAQLYSAALAGAILAVLLALRDRLPREGDLFRLYLVLYGVGRFAVEFFRERTAGPTGLSTAQWACLAMAAAGLALLIRPRPALREASA